MNYFLSDDVTFMGKMHVHIPPYVILQSAHCES